MTAECNLGNILKLILAFIFPPLGVFLDRGCDLNFHDFFGELMNNALLKLKLSRSGKDKTENLKRIEDTNNNNNKVTVQPNDYTGILKARVNTTRKIIPGKKYKGILSCGILTLGRLKIKKAEKIGVDNRNLKNITIDLSGVDIYYDDTKYFFSFNIPNVCLRVQPKQKEYENWKQMILQHKWYIQYKNKGIITFKKDGIKIPDIEIDDETSDYTEDSSRRTKTIDEAKYMNTFKEKNQISQTKEIINNNEKLLSSTSDSLSNEKKSKNVPDLKSSEMMEEMMELIKLLMSTVQTMNDRIIKLEMSISVKDTDSNKDNSKELSEKINDLKDKNEEMIKSSSLKESTIASNNDSYPLSPSSTTDKTPSIFIDYKNKKRRETLPTTQTIPESLSYTQIFKCLLSGGHFPISIYEPISSIQLLCCEVQNAKILNNITNLTDPIERILKVAEFVIGSSGDCLIPGRRKCFTSFPGETFDYISNDGWKFHGEHILKSPMTLASYIEHETWEMFMAAELRCNISYNVIEIKSDLPIRLNVKNKESFIWTKPKFVISNIKSLPKNRQSYYNDTIKIHNSSGLTIELTFNKKGEVYGKLINNNKVTLAEIEGNYFSVVKYTINSKQYTLYTAPNISTYNENYYSFNQFTIGINEIFKDEAPYIPRSDSRHRNDIRYLEEGLTEKSNSEKISLSVKYKNLTEHNPLWFTKVYDQFSNAILYKSNSKYWQSKMEKFNTEEGKKVPILF
uniref:Major facilitator superfamily (MFS) profile domain-containing protein n=2 Tax=Strongyloides stercoralis TaxID=6248 RepID=A0AAF5CVC7_STRER